MSEPTVEIDGLVLPAGLITGHAGRVKADGSDPDPHPDVTSWDGVKITFTPTVPLVVYDTDDGPVLLQPQAETGVYRDGRIVLDILEGQDELPLRLWATTDQPMTPPTWGWQMSYGAGAPSELLKVKPKPFVLEPGAVVNVTSIVRGELPEVPAPSVVDLDAALAEMRDLRTESTDAADSATVAASTAVAARDATLAAAVITGAGRPDIPGTMTPEVAALVAAATSGAVFRSTDGPQGAWQWRRRGATWVCEEGDTEWRALCRWSGGAITEGTAPAGIGPRGNATGGIFLRRAGATITLSIVEGQATAANPEIPSPIGFRGNSSLPYPAVPIYYRLAAGTEHVGNIDVGAVLYRLRVPSGAILASLGTGGYGVVGSWSTSIPAWPTSLPGTAA